MPKNNDFALSMKGVATELIGGFGSTGKILTVTTKPDSITGMGGSETEEDVIYFREFFSGRELIGSRINEEIANRIENDDATIYVVFDKRIYPDMAFKDDKGLRWNIISATPIEAEGTDVMYEVHIRK